MMQERDKIRAWLTPPDSYHEAEYYRDDFENAIMAKTDGTCEWLIKHETFSRWKNSSSSFLWLCGGPGMGKTTAMARAIEVIREQVGAQPAQGVLYFFFNEKGNDVHKMSLEAALRSLIFQQWLVEDSTKISPAWRSILNATQTHGRQLSQLKTTMARVSLLHKSLYIFIDGLDECDGARDLISTLRSIRQQELDGVKIMVSSRPELFTTLRQAQDTDIQISVELTKEDLNHHITQVVGTAIQLNLIKITAQSPLKQEIVTTLRDRADGM
jgi:NACHT domain